MSIFMKDNADWNASIRNEVNTNHDFKHTQQQNRRQSVCVPSSLTRPDAVQCISDSSRWGIRESLLSLEWPSPGGVS